jgi:hypothetical protein
MTNYPKKGRAEDSKRHPWGPLTSTKKTHSESSSRETTTHGKNGKNELQLNIQIPHT